MACQTLFAWARLFFRLCSRVSLGSLGRLWGLGPFDHAARTHARPNIVARQRKKRIEKKLHKPQHDFLHERRASFFASGVTFCARFLYFIV